MRVLVIGSARHGKDSVAEFIKELYGLTFESSSIAASRIFLYNALKDKYGYASPEQCFADRVNHRDEWHDLICEYNKDDKARLAKAILETSDMYVGMRSDAECDECQRQGLFDLIIGVYNPRLPEEPKSSFSINMWEKSDFVIPNSGTLDDLKASVAKLGKLFAKEHCFDCDMKNVKIASLQGNILGLIDGLEWHKLSADVMENMRSWKARIEKEIRERNETYN